MEAQLTAREQAVETAKAEKKDVEANVENEVWLEAYQDKQRDLAKEKARAQERLANAQAGIDEKLEAMSLEDMREKISKLRASIASGGEIKAPADGKIVKLEAAVGQAIGMTIGQYTQPQEGMTFTARMDKEAAKYFLKGDSAEISFPDSDAETVETVIDEIKPVEGESGMVDVIIPIEDSEAEIGETAKLVARKETAVFECVVPLEVLRSDSDGDFVLVLRDRQNAWGTSQYVERVTVNVREKDANYAAIEGMVGSWDKVVRRSNKDIANGQSVQVMSN